MKADIHPAYHTVKVLMTDGTEAHHPDDLGQGGRHAPPGHRSEVASGLDRRRPAALLDRGGRLSRFREEVLEPRPQEVKSRRRPRKTKPPQRGSFCVCPRADALSRLFDRRISTPIGEPVPTSPGFALMALVALESRRAAAWIWRSRGLVETTSSGIGAWIVASSRRTASMQLAGPRDQRQRARRQRRERLLVDRITGRELDLGLFLVGLGERHLALVHRAMQQQPRGELHQPEMVRRMLSVRVGQRRGAIEASWNPGGRDRRDRTRSPRPASCRRETAPRRLQTPRAYAPNDTGCSPTDFSAMWPHAPTIRHNKRPYPHNKRP